MSDALAHSGGHLLVAHLETVAQLAAEFSNGFDAADPVLRWAYLAGLWHDMGKYRPGFQRYVRLADNPDSHIEGKVGGRERPTLRLVRYGPCSNYLNLMDMCLPT